MRSPSQRTRREIGFVNAGLADPFGKVQFGAPNNLTQNQGLVRIDYQINSRHSVFGRYYITHLEQPPGNAKVNPDGTTTVMLFDKNILQDWPTPFIFKDPVSLPKDTELAVVGYYSDAGTMPETGGIRLTVATSPTPRPHR